MEPIFDDRILLCSDCHGEFIFTAGEQLFFHDKQFKNDPKRLQAVQGPALGPFSRGQWRGTGGGGAFAH